MNARIHVPRVLQAMNLKGWGVAATCVNCGVNNKTLAKVLKGQLPRLDAFYRLIKGLNIPTEEAVIGSTHKAADGPRLYLVSRRRKSNKVPGDNEEGSGSASP
jgi:lambda repressor-like predicted transcriptional regulator